MEYNKALWLKAAKEVQDTVLSQKFFAEFKKGKMTVKALPDEELLSLTATLLEPIDSLPTKAPELVKEEAELEAVSKKIVNNLASTGFSYDQLEPYNSNSNKITDAHHVYVELQSESEETPSLGLTYCVSYVKNAGILNKKSYLEITVTGE